MPEPLPQKIWQLADPDPLHQRLLSDGLDIHPIAAQLLVNRGILTVADGRSFLSGTLTDIHDPFLLKDMDKAVARVRLARERGETVMVFGDYDVDGVTSSAVLYTALTALGLKVVTHIPHRVHDGYGLNAGAARLAREQGAALVITVDCGITAVAEVDLLNQEGLDVIVIDHHEPSEAGIPRALAVVDPKQHDCPYPFKSLAAVGLAAKFVQALRGSVDESSLDLVALGTIADVVPLRGENRILVKAGLPRLSRTANKGLAALMESAGIRDKKFRSYYAGFILGPRINATGRLDSAHKSLELLLSTDETRARELAAYLETLNTERQRMQRIAVQEAVAQVEQERDLGQEKVLVLSKEGWHKGVLGIVAARMAEMYYRPSIVISLHEGVGTASARSIEGFHLHEALQHCSGILETFGGHKQAAGLTIRQENIHSFRERINGFARELLELKAFVPQVGIDCEVPLAYLSLDLHATLQQLEPFGEGNPPPVFCTRRLTVKGRPAVLGRETLKFMVTDGQTSVSAVGFGMGKYAKALSPGQTVDLAYELSVDDWNKAPVVQLKLVDIRESRPAR